jgi:hypothetical protein
MGNSVQENRQLQAALAAHAQAPDSLAPLHDICSALLELNLDEEALPWADKALALDPRRPRFVYLRAHALTLLGRHFDAAATWLHYASLPWKLPFYHLELGRNLAMVGDFDRGISLLNSAWRAALAAGDPIALVAERRLGEAMLKKGDAEGFTHWLALNQGICFNYRPDGVPDWTGAEDLSGKRILLTHQLGFGDQFLLFSCVSRWLAAGVSLMITCDFKIHKVIQQSLPQCVVVGAESPTDYNTPLPKALLPAVQAFRPNIHVSLLHLPMLAVRQAALPGPYFRAYVEAPLPERNFAVAWAHSLRLRHSGKALIGLCWDCVFRHSYHLAAEQRCWAARRSLPLQELNRLVCDAGVRGRTHFVFLQPPAAEQFTGAPAENISSYTPGIKDFADTAACIAELDAVITVDTAVANLSAMMGKRTVVMAHSSCDWRWGSQGPTTPWMDNVKVLRQVSPGDWSTVVDEIIQWMSREFISLDRAPSQ